MLCLLGVGCEAPTPPGDVPLDAGTSPNASILPLPLATDPPDLLDAGAPPDAAVRGMMADERGRLIVPDSGPPPPTPLQPDTPLPAEAPSSREVSGVTLDAEWRWRDVRIRFTSRALPLPGGAEIRGRADRYGAIVLWPNSTDFRVIPPGALRTTIGERRVDVTPLSLGTARSAGEGARLGAPLRRIEIGAGLGTLRLELGKVPEAGDGGAVLCRAVVEILGVDPRTPECQPGEVPILAEYAWQEGGGVSLEVTSIVRRTDLASSDLLVPPPGAKLAPAGLPVAPGGIFLTREELAAFRTGPIALPSPPAPSAPGEGFIAVNQTDTLYYFLVDGVPVVAVPPLSERYVVGTDRGRYMVQWRTFLGETIEPARAVEMPARLVLGGADAGAPDGG
jgi:hypothetical protein